MILIIFLAIIYFIWVYIANAISAEDEIKTPQQKTKLNYNIKVEVKNQETNTNVLQTTELPSREYAPTVYKGEAEAVFLDWSRKGKPLGCDYPQYFYYNYNITNPEVFHKCLISSGLLEQASIETTLNYLIKEDVEDLAFSLGLAKKKTKKTLIKDILETVPQEKLAFALKDMVLYAPSEFGKEFLEENDIFVELKRHRNWDLSYEEYQALSSNLNYKLSFYDFARLEFERRLKLNSSQTKLAGARSDLYHLYELHKLSGSKQQAAQCLLTVFYNDLCFPDYGVFFAPAVVSGIFKLKPYITDEFLDEFCKNQSESTHCTKAQFRIIVKEIFDNTFDPKYWERILNADRG